MKPREKCVKLLSYGPSVALIGSLLIGSPLAIAQNLDSRPGEPLRLTVAPHASSRIAMKTLPKATCVLHVEGDSDTSRSFKLFSDDEGMIRFNINPSEESDEVTPFAVDCTAGNGQSGTFGLELRSSTTPTLDMPAPVAEIRAPKASDVVRPALTKQEALELSDDELAAREYPVRPNHEQAPSAFAHWLQVVSKPARRVNARQVANPELQASTLAGTPNWSGFDLKNAPNEVPVSTYNGVEAVWDVPTVTAPVSEGTTYSVFWVGLDGDQGVCPTYCPLNSAGNHNTPDLWQAGTLQQTRNIFCCVPPIIRRYNISTYYAWTELLPTQSIELLPNFNVLPGDQMFIEVWVGNPGQSPSLSGADGIAFVEDESRSVYTYVYTPRGQVNILGYQAEWIMERPYENGVLPDLSDYTSAYMIVPFAEQINGDWVSYDGGVESGTAPDVAATSEQLYMYNPNTGDLLSEGYPYGSGAIYFQWYSFH